MIVFFVLSGYLITTLLLREQRDRAIDLRAFYLRRAARILPAMLLTLMLATVLLVALEPAERAKELVVETVLPALGFVSNIVSAFTWQDDPARFLTVMWSLSLEEQFYFLWPGVVLLATRRGTRGSLFIAALSGAVLFTAIRLGMIAVGASPQHVNFAPYSRADAILLGCALAVLLAAKSLPRARLVGWVGVVLATVSLVAVSRPEIAYSAAAIGSACIIAAVVQGGGLLAWLLSTSALRYLGRISYSLYLYHLMILYLFSELWGQGFGIKIAWLACSMIAASLSTVFMEEPLTEVGRRRSAPQPRPATQVS